LDEPQPREPEIPHRAGGRADVLAELRLDENDDGAGEAHFCFGLVGARHIGSPCPAAITSVPAQRETRCPPRPSAAMTIIRRVLTYHWLTTLFLMGVFALLFGLGSFNLFMILHANLDLILAHGVMALRDGALAQLIELIAYGYFSVTAFLL